MKWADSRHQLREVYGEHAMSDSMVRRWVRHFNEGCGNVHDDPWSGQPFVVDEGLVRALEEKIQENRRFTISSLSLHFPQMSSLHHKIVPDKLRFQKLCSRWVLKMLMEEHRMQRQASVLTFVILYSEQGISS
jgi:transposase